MNVKSYDTWVEQKTSVNIMDEQDFGKGADLQQLKLSYLAQQCQINTELYFKQERSDSSYGLELWRRAVVDHDEAAWELIINQYTFLVRNWVSHYFAYLKVLTLEIDELVNSVFFNFYRFVSPEKFASFNSLAGVLKYLKLCCTSIAIDTQRSYRASSHCFSLQAVDQQTDDGKPGAGQLKELKATFDMEDTVLQWVDRSSFWEKVWLVLVDQTDRLLIYLRYILDMPAREIVRFYPQHFSDVTAVYRRNKNILWRLRKRFAN